MTFSSVKYRIILHGMHLGGKSCRSSNGWLLNYSWALKLILNHSRALHWEINVCICCWLFLLIRNIALNYDWLHTISLFCVIFFFFDVAVFGHENVFLFATLLGKLRRFKQTLELNWKIWIVNYCMMIKQINVFILGKDSWSQPDMRAKCSVHLYWIVIFFWGEVLSIFVCRETLCLPLIYILVSCMSRHRAAACCGYRDTMGHSLNSQGRRTRIGRRENGQ